MKSGEYKIKISDIVKINFEKFNTNKISKINTNNHVEKEIIFKDEIVLLADRYMKIVQETRNWWKGYQQDCIDSATKELEKKNDNKKGLYKNK
tara:strand:- start:8022 stop:8300 length:279 start_codon:yes stop_codon:yes gene_type:complete